MDRVTVLNKEERLQPEDLTAYNGLQNEPLGQEPSICISFPISLRIFCIAFALSQKETEKGQNKGRDNRTTKKATGRTSDSG